MKRLFTLAFVIFLGAMIIAPLRIAHQNNNFSLQTSVAQACSSTEVEIAFPILNGGSKCVDNNKDKGGAIVSYLKLLLILFGRVIGAVIVLMLVIAGIQYMLSQGDAAQIKKAKDRIQNAIIALILFLSAAAILNYLIPGGLN